MNNYIKEIKAILIFIIIGILIFGFPTLLAYFKIEYYFYYSLIIYTSLCAVLAILSNISNSKILKKITNYILLPAGIILSIVTIIMPFGFLLIHVICYLAFVILIPNIILKLLILLDVCPVINPYALIYVKFTSSVFIAVLFNFQLRHLIYKISPVRLKSSEKLKAYELDKLTDYLLSENNVRFTIYSLYAVILIIINFLNLEENSLSTNGTNDKAILQSFVTFISFDRALTLLKQLEFKPSDFLNKIIKSIINKFKDLDKNGR